MPRAFLVAAGLERRALTPATRRYPFRRDHPDTHLVFSDFRQGGGCAMVADKRGQERRALTLRERE
jgi:hypothetical protein